MRRASTAAFAAVSLALAACSSSSPDPTGSGGSGGGAATASFSFQFTTPPGQETHFCQSARLPKTDSGDVLVTGYTWKWDLLHHWALYRTTGDLPSDVSLDE